VSPCLVWISCFTPCFVVLCSFYLDNHSESCHNRTELYGQLNPDVHQKLKCVNDSITAYLNIYFSSLEFFIIQALHSPFKGLKSEVFLCPNWTLGSTEPRCIENSSLKAKMLHPSTHLNSKIQLQTLNGHGNEGRH